MAFATRAEMHWLFLQVGFYGYYSTCSAREDHAAETAWDATTAPSPPRLAVRVALGRLPFPSFSTLRTPSRSRFHSRWTKESPIVRFCRIHKVVGFSTFTHDRDIILLLISSMKEKKKKKKNLDLQQKKKKTPPSTADPLSLSLPHFFLLHLSHHSRLLCSYHT